MSEDTVLLEGSAGGIPAPGSEVGGYLLGEELGRGAQGAVYAASLAGDERLFAVKIVTLAGADAPMLVRLRREATLTARMAHPGIVTVHQVVETQRYLAIVMDRACGRPADRLCDGSLGWELALRIVVAAARALDYAHRRNGLIHRDLKPGNLIADIRGGVMHGMKVVDFGLGRDRSSAGAEVTMAGQVMGTPWYISPEQARGERDLTFATDIYSLGATLFHLVAGRPVFDAGSPIRTIMAHASEAPPTLASCVPACPVALSELVGYCLAKSPAQRFRSYRTFLAMAEPLLGGNPFEQVDADVPVTGATTRSAWRRPTTEVTADKPATTTRSLYRPPGHPGREVQPAPAPASTSEPRGTTRFMFPAVKLPASAPEAAVPSEPRRRDPATETTAIPASEIERTVGPAPDAIPAKSSLQPGERIDEHFTIVRALGSGAMGEVYEVEDQFIGRRLAMKIMSEADMMRPAAVARFKCEAAALASVGHVAFPYLAGGGTYRDRDYLYMELVQGVDLRTWLQRSGGVLPERTALSIALQLAQAMEAAYRVCGMVHRDLKPANIMIAESWDGSPQARIIDFGVSVYIDYGEWDDYSSRAYTYVDDGNEGRIVGTPAYMGPEQAQAGPPSPLMDMYAIGAILHQLLTGRTPFTAPGVAALLVKILNESAPTLEDVDGIAPATRQLVRRMLAKKPEARFKNYAQLIAAIGAAQHAVRA